MGNDWNRDNTATIVSQEGEIGEDAEDNKDQREEFFNGRVNDGTDLSLKDAIELNDPKWIHDDSIMIAESIFKGLKPVEESFVERSSCKLEKIQKTSSSGSGRIIDICNESYVLPSFHRQTNNGGRKLERPDGRNSITSPLLNISSKIILLPFLCIFCCLVHNYSSEGKIENHGNIHKYNFLHLH